MGMELFQWYNLVFAAPILLAGVYLALSAAGGAGGHDHDTDVGADHDIHVDHDVAVDHDVDAGHDVDVDHDVDADHDVDVDHDVDADADADAAPVAETHGVEHEVHESEPGHEDASMLMRALTVLGFGKVPVSILVTCLMVIFGVVGLISNGIFASVLPWKWGPTLYFWPSLALATFLSCALTGAAARALHRVMPTSETYAVRPEALVGSTGHAVYPLILGVKGVVDVTGPDGTVCRIAGQPLEGEIEKGREVILTRYHRDADYYDVTASPL